MISFLLYIIIGQAHSFDCLSETQKNLTNPSRLRNLLTIIQKDQKNLIHTEENPNHLNPHFSGSLDWHSAVHSRWAELKIKSLLKTPLTKEDLKLNSLTSLSKEFEYNFKQNKKHFIPTHEIPYGANWLLLYFNELQKTPEFDNENLTPFLNEILNNLYNWMTDEKNTNDFYGRCGSSHQSWELNFYLLMNNPVHKKLTKTQIEHLITLFKNSPCSQDTKEDITPFFSLKSLISSLEKKYSKINIKYRKFENSEWIDQDKTFKQPEVVCHLLKNNKNSLLDSVFAHFLDDILMNFEEQTVIEKTKHGYILNKEALEETIKSNDKIKSAHKPSIQITNLWFNSEKIKSFDELRYRDFNDQINEAYVFIQNHKDDFEYSHYLPQFYIYLIEQIEKI